MWRRRDQGPTSPPPFYRVVSLGLSGSGKTVLLASMFHELNMPRLDKRTYHLETGHKETIDLNDIRGQVTTPGKAWPPGTQVGELREFLFTFVAKRGDKRHKLFQMSYLDYPGELHEDMTDLKLEDLEQLDHHIANAHALFGILDGRRLAQYIRGEQDGLGYMNSALTPMLSKLVGAQCPIHFIVTKWDLVADIGEPDDGDGESRLALVAKALKDHTDFGDLLKSTAASGQSVRLIPVSAIGNRFAELDSEGEMVKLPNAEVDPINLDVPVSAVLPDYFSQIQSALSDDDLDKIRGRRTSGSGRRSSVQSILKVLSVAAVASIETVMRINPAVAIAGAGTGLLFDWLAGPAELKAQLAEDDRRANAVAARDRREAELSLLDDFRWRMYQMDKEYPSSRLTHD